jgi:hypothetical protein
MTSNDIPAPAKGPNFSPNEIILYGVRLNGNANSASIKGPGERMLRLTLVGTDDKGVQREIGEDKAVIAALYGYAFEGHCYRVDRPRIIAFEHAAPGGETAIGCGFEKLEGSSYLMWRIRPDTKILELTVGVDDAEALILQANLPGRRAPNTYDGHMRLAHRGGRLTGGDS